MDEQVHEHDQPADDNQAPESRDMHASMLAAENAELLARLRQALLASAPEIEPSLVKGESLAEIEESFAAAQATLERVRAGVRRELAALVPAGSLSRTQSRPATAIEKIRAGLAKTVP